MADRYPSGTNQDDGKINRTIVSRFTASGRELAVPSTSQSVYNSSTCDINCDICSEDGEIKEAVGYCSNCKEYYCHSCLRAHSKNKATEDHTLLDQSTMPTVEIIPVPSSHLQINLNKGSDTFNDQCSDEFQFNRDINIKVPDDKNECIVTGMVAVSDRNIVVVDQENKSVKMIDIIDDVMNGYKSFDDKPLHIASLLNAEVAVTFPKERLIRILTTTGGGVTVKRTLKLNGMCTAVEYCNDKLYVSFQKPVKFQILSLSGGVKQTIQPDAQFLKHCKLPCYIAVHPAETSIYVTDWKNNVVLSMDMSGVLLGVYKDVELEKPQDITFTPFGSIYICNPDQHIVNKLTEDLSEASIVLTGQDGLRYPLTMCFCHARRYLLISSASSDLQFHNFIKLYKYK